jgi:hypothetical protein
VEKTMQRDDEAVTKENKFSRMRCGFIRSGRDTPYEKKDETLGRIASLRASTALEAPSIFIIKRSGAKRSEDIVQ